MKKLFITLLVGPVVLCMLSDSVLAATQTPPQSPCQAEKAWWNLWGRLTPPCGPQIPGYSPVPSNSNQSNGANPFPTQTPLQTAYQPPPGWFSNAFHRLFGGSSPTPQPVANPFGIVRSASATAPPAQPIPDVNQPRANFVQPAPQTQEVRTNASQPIPASQPTGGQSIQEQLARMTSTEKSRLNAQTDAAFYAKYPQMAGQKIDPVANPQAAQQWIAERNNILAANARAASGSPTQQLSSNPISQPQQTRTSVAPTNAPLPTIPTFSAQPGVSAPSTASRSTSYPPLPAIPQLPSSSASQSAPPAQQHLPPQPQLPANTPAAVIASQPAHVPPPQSSGAPIVNGHVASPEVAQQIRQNLQQNNFIQPQTVSSPPPRPQTQQAQLAQKQLEERQRQALLAQKQQQERQRQAQLAQQKEQERKRQVQLAQQKEQERQRQAQLAQRKEQERKRQVQLAQQKEQERQRQAQLAQRKEQERQRQAQLAQQKQQERQMKAYVKQQEAYQRWQQQEAYRQWQQQQIYQQPPQQDNSAEEQFYATHGGRNALTEAAWQSGAYR